MQIHAATLRNSLHCCALCPKGCTVQLVPSQLSQGKKAEAPGHDNIHQYTRQDKTIWRTLADMDWPCSLMNLLTS